MHLHNFTHCLMPGAHNSFMAQQGPKPDARWALLTLCSLQAAAVFLQAISAGSFLSGTDHSVRLHELGGWITFALALAQAALAAARYVRELGWWFVSSSAAVAVAEVLQLGTGYGRFLQVHIPLAILIVALLVWQLLWAVMHRTATMGRVAES